MNCTCRHVIALNCPVLSKLEPVQPGSFAGSWFKCLQATSQALQPIHRLVSVKNPIAGCCGKGNVLLPTSVDTTLPSDALCPLVVDREGSTAMTPPYGIRPGRMLQVNALASSMLTFGSRTMCARSLVILPVLLPWKPQWNGRPIWCTTRFPR